MASIIYNRYVDGVRDFQTASSGTYRWLLLKGSGYTPNPDHDFVSDLTPGSNEVAGSGYSRQNVTSPTRTVDDANNKVTLDAADPSFGSIVAGESVTGIVLFKFVTNDSDSELIAYLALPATATDGFAFGVALNGSGIIYFDQA